MEHLIIPDGYASPLTIRETEVAIKEIKDHFERSLAKSLHLTRVSAPLFVTPKSGLNDNLNGVERPVSFGISPCRGPHGPHRGGRRRGDVHRTGGSGGRTLRNAGSGRVLHHQHGRRSPARKAGSQRGGGDRQPGPRHVPEPA